MNHETTSTRRRLLQAAAASCGAFPLISPASAVPVAKSQGLIVPAHEGLNWEMSPGRSIQYKLMSGQTNEQVSIFEETVPVGAGTPLHIHRTSDEIIHVLSGELTIRLNTRVEAVGPGAWIYIPRGVTHGWRNHGSAAARASYTFTPAHGGKVFEESRSLGHVPSSDAATMKKLEALMKRYGYVLVALEWK